MKIERITSQHRRGFQAILICEHCNQTKRLTCGYDDENFHKNVIPNIPCSACGKTAPENYRPMATKYPAGQGV
jgi:transcription elongation factor Elf1